MRYHPLIMPLAPMPKVRPLAFYAYRCIININMPSRNIVKQYANDSYYHIYSRGVNKELIFREPTDYHFFLSILRRYLSPDNIKNKSYKIYPKFEGLQLISFCLMPNHLHLLIYQNDSKTIEKFMRSIITTYVMYFNKKYDRQGPLFQSKYKASLIDHDAYLHHISRYIHLNPPKWRSYPYSSLAYIMGEKNAAWVKPKLLLGLFDNNKEKYLDFIKDYEDQKEMLDELKWELADTN